MVVFLEKSLLSLFLLLSLLGCSNDDDKEVDPISVDRTVLFYLVADNNLYSFIQNDFEEIVAGCKNGIHHGDVLVYFDKKETAPHLYHINENGATLLKTYPEQLSTSVTVMEEVIKEVFDDYPSESKGLFLSSHGEGWLFSDLISSINSSRKVSRCFGVDEDGSPLDEDKVGYLDIPDLKKVLSTAVPDLDFLVFDACLMASIEVVYELRNSADYILASPSTVSSFGYTYNEIMPFLFAEGEPKYREIASNFYHSYVDGILSSDAKDVTVSLIKTSELKGLADSISVLLGSQAATLSNYLSSIGAQEYDARTTPCLYFDLGHVMQIVGKNDSHLVGVLTQLRKAVPFHLESEVLESNSQRIKLEHCNGLSTYVPQYVAPFMTNISFQVNYSTLEWFEDSNWFLFSGWEKDDN